MARQFKSQLDEEVVKADRDWSKPAPSSGAKRPGITDLDASPNRNAPPPAAAPPPPGPEPADDSRTVPEPEPAAAPAPAAAPVTEERADEAQGDPGPEKP